MDKITIAEISLLRRDLTLRGYNQEEIDQLLDTPLLIVPGPLTPENATIAEQKLTRHQVMLGKDFAREGVPYAIADYKNEPRRYIEERHAHVDLGTIVFSLHAIQQLDSFASIAQILDFFLSLIQFKFSRGRTQQLMPIVGFELDIHNGSKMARLRTSVPADEAPSLIKSEQIQELIREILDNGD